MLLISSFIFLRHVLFASLHGSSQTCEEEHNPCSYEAVLPMIKEGTELNLNDKFIQGKEELTSFRSFINQITTKVSIINGRNTTIDGEKSDHFYPAFIEVQNRDLLVIQNINFANFRSPIIWGRNLSRCIFNKINISFSRIDKQLGLVIFSHSRLTLRKICLLKNTIHDSPLFSIHSSSIDFDQTNIDNNFCSHQISIPFLHCIKSHINLNNSLFIRNHSPYSPLFTLEYKSFLSISGTNILESTHTEILFGEGITSVFIINSNISKNYGLVFSAADYSELEMKSVMIEQNFSPQHSLFELINVTSVFSDCIFHNNVAFDIIGLSGSLSKLVLKNITFNFNDPLSYIIRASNNTEMTIKNAIFNENHPGNGLTHITNSSARIEDIMFLHSTNSALKSFKSKVFMTNSEFKFSHSNNHPMIYSNMSEITLSSINFTDITYNNQIISFKDDIKMDLLRFEFAPKNVLPKNLRNRCENCYFKNKTHHQKEKKSVFSFDMLFIGTLFLMVCFLVYKTKRRILFSLKKMLRRRPTD